MSNGPGAVSPFCPLPIDRALMVQRWLTLTFLHWRYDPAVVQALLPSGLRVDVRDGVAWVGLVPFWMTVRVPLVPSLPWLSRFCETNVAP